MNIKTEVLSRSTVSIYHMRGLYNPSGENKARSSAYRDTSQPKWDLRTGNTELLLVKKRDNYSLETAPSDHSVDLKINLNNARSYVIQLERWHEVKDKSGRSFAIQFEYDERFENFLDILESVLRMLGKLERKPEDMHAKIYESICILDTNRPTRSGPQLLKTIEDLPECPPLPPERPNKYFIPPPASAHDDTDDYSNAPRIENLSLAEIAGLLEEAIGQGLKDDASKWAGLLADKKANLQVQPIMRLDETYMAPIRRPDPVTQPAEQNLYEVPAEIAPSPNASSDYSLAKAADVGQGRAEVGRGGGRGTYSFEKLNLGAGADVDIENRKPPSSPKGWACGSCTYINKLSASECELCSTARP